MRSAWWMRLPELAEASLRELVEGQSHFLSREIRRHPEWLPQWLESGALHRGLTRDDYVHLADELPQDGSIAPALLLARHRHRCLLRILIRDALGFALLAETTEEISLLADSILDWGCRYVRRDLELRYGQARNEAGRAAGFSVLALGKLGGMELNYSSDVDLLYLYEGAGETAGPARISNKEFFAKLAHQLTQLLSQHSEAGICYRVDLRLRPDGSLGEVASSLDSAKVYYAQRARDWELQMMIKARVAAGDLQPGQDLLDFVEPLTYSTSTDFSAIEAVSATRLRLNEKLAARSSRARGFDIKLAPGGIRDIEFLVQCLQRLHGGREPWVRHGGTMLALGRLHDKNLISAGEYFQLIEAYEFLRHVEHRLQILEDRQTHLLPADTQELQRLAERMPDLDPGVPNSAERLSATLTRHLESVRSIYERVVHTKAVLSEAGGAPRLSAEEPSLIPASMQRLLEYKTPALARKLEAGALRRNLQLWERFAEQAGERLEMIERDEVLMHSLFDVFSHSPQLADELIRDPSRLDDLNALRQRPTSRADLSEVLDVAGPSELRRAYRRHSFLIQIESLCFSAPVFSTLDRMSEVADAAIAAAYRLALADVGKTKPIPAPRMMVVALGRLGMREFDLASDADLIFILPDSEAEEQPFWTKVAARLMEILGAYTGDGTVFAVDTRLRPNGRAGELVQLEKAYKEYFSQSAEAWEGIAYMKARAVAGDLDRATAFLHELQQLDWRRYGQSHRSLTRQSLAQLREIRLRLEREQGKSQPLKSGRGAYYDIDFTLLFLRLKGAGIFFKVLNTPERIDVLEKMGHLEREDAAFLLEAATLYRALDHGLRLYSGQPAGELNGSPALAETIGEMLNRWVPGILRGGEWKLVLQQTQDRTRECFDRLFQ
jgi:[glutamine synthetase] adenylyltransferase / [glutamine synthetase]-adenylyl-L-tyrosine phosphorylase